MTIHLTQLRSILVPVDFSKHSVSALEQAIWLSKKFESKVHVIHIYRDKPSWADDVVTPLTLGYTAKNFDLLLREAAELTMEKFLKPYASIGQRLSHEVVQGSAVQAILAAADQGKFDLLVMGRRGGGDLPHVLLGSTADKVIRNSRVPVLVVPERPFTELKNILVPVDFSDSSKDGFEAAHFLAKKVGANITALYISEPPVLLMSAYEYLPPRNLDMDLVVQIEKAEKEMLQDFVKPYQKEGRAITSQVTTGSPAVAIVEACEEIRADLMVMGSQGRGKIGQLLMGSVAEKVLKLSTAPLLIIKHRTH